MKIRIVAAAAALLSLATPTVASADDGLNYNDLIHCAAFNQVVAGVLGLGDGAAKNKDQIETFNNQSVSLMVIAAVSADKDAETVAKEVSAKSDVMIDTLADESKQDAFLEENFDKCNSMGKAAAEVVAEATKDK